MSMKRKLHLTIVVSLLIACGLVLATTGSASNAAKVVTFNTDAASVLQLPTDHALAATIFLGHPVKITTKLQREPVASFATIDRFDGEALR